MWVTLDTLVLDEFCFWWSFFEGLIRRIEGYPMVVESPFGSKKSSNMRDYYKY